MNKEDIIRMAREADLIYWRPNSTFSDGVWWMDAGQPADELEHFAALVAAAERKAVETEYPVKFASVKAFEDWCASIRANEREACAEICDRFQARDVGMQPAECAGAIRARGNQ